MPNLSKVAPSEGLVFKYNGKVFKFTGFFAPINQILGLEKFSRQVMNSEDRYLKDLLNGRTPEKRVMVGYESKKEIR